MNTAPTSTSRSRWRGVVRWAALVAIAAGWATVAACSRKVGDECMTGADCDPTGGTRLCDLSQPGGYCLVDGCDAQSCPSDSVCVRFFPESYLSQPCDPQASDTGSGAGGASGCSASELCLWSGLCAQRSSEKRACMQSCEGNGDCRGGYECRLTGTRGTMPLTGSTTAKPPASGTAGLPRFCAPI